MHEKSLLFSSSTLINESNDESSQSIMMSGEQVVPDFSHLPLGSGSSSSSSLDPEEEEVMSGDDGGDGVQNFIHRRLSRQLYATHPVQNNNRSQEEWLQKSTQDLQSDENEHSSLTINDNDPIVIHRRNSSSVCLPVMSGVNNPNAPLTPHYLDVYNSSNNNRFPSRRVSRDVITAEKDALLYMMMYDNSLVQIPSCDKYLMEDRIEAHKLTGSRSPADLARHSSRLALLETLSGPLITRSFTYFDSVPERLRDKSTTKFSTLHGEKRDCVISIMQWNVLSQAIGYHCDNFSTCIKSDILWSARKWKIIFEIAQYSADVICLQEVDRFYFIHKMLQKVGYDGKFVGKPDSPCNHLPGNTGPDGCAIFYNTNRLVLMKTTHRIIQVFGCPSNQVILLCHFKCKLTGKTFCVATTHLKARKGKLLASFRNEQGKDILNFLEDECGSRPFVVTGDFNARSTEPVYRTMTKTLSSAYSGQKGDSNWTCRVGEDETKQTVDYIFYQKDKMSVSCILNLDSCDLKCAIPNDQYPSDHLSLVAKLHVS